MDTEPESLDGLQREPKDGGGLPGDRFDLSGDFRGAVINIKSTIVGPAEVRDIEDLPPEPGESPFLGLQYFDEQDAGRFFGRELLTSKIVGRLHSSRFLAILGASGSGKSSLVRAGVIPALRRGERLVDGSLPPTASQRWEIQVLTPTAHPLGALAAALGRESDPLPALAEIQAELARNHNALSMAVSKFLARSTNSHFLLVIDQFEEVYTLCRHPEEREAFISNLLSATDPELLHPVTVLISIRADFYAQLSEHDQLREVVSQNQEFIGAMNREELFRAIVQPAALGKWKVQEGLVEVMLRDAGDEPGALPLLSHALLETWKRRRGRTLTLSGYNESGGVRGAIAQTAEAVFQQRLTPEQRPIAQMIFIRLAELNKDSQDTRRRASFSELITAASDEKVIQVVLDILTESRLIITGTQPPDDEKVVEVAHEALIREWPTLRDWLDENRAGLILHRQLTADTNDWVKLDRDPGSLYRGLRLRQMLAWQAGYSGTLSLVEREFLKVSESNELAELARARQLARARRTQRILLGLSGGLLIVLVLFWMVSSGVIANFRTPARMQGIYNVAIAEASLITPDGGTGPTENAAGMRLGGWLAGFLKEELASDADIWVWQDSPELRRQNVRIGRVDPAGEGKGAQPAADLAQRLDADMLVFGNIDTRQDPAQLVLEFWLTPQEYSGFEEVQGIHKITTPVLILNPRDPGLEVQPELRRQAGTLAWVAMGLTYAQLGQTQSSLEAFQKAAALAPESEVVQFFLGREYLFLAAREPIRQVELEDSAEQAFANSTLLNAGYARGYIGLGSVYFTRAWRLLAEAPEEDGGSEIEVDISAADNQINRAIAAYQSAIDLQPDASDYGTPVESTAQLGLGKSYRLKGAASILAGDAKQAQLYLEQAIGILEPLVQPFEDGSQARYLAQTYEGLGLSYYWLGYLFETMQMYENSLADYRRSLDYYGRCIAYGDASPDQVIRNDIVRAHCIPNGKAVQEIIDSLDGDQG
jgi:tetratricopeptide (TPR) repeat protein/energy-coupling factor transporter ATP-binding protein EcfA2